MKSVMLQMVVVWEKANVMMVHAFPSHPKISKARHPIVIDVLRSVSLEVMRESFTHG